MKPVKYEQTMINEPPTRRLDAALAMPCKTQKRCPMAYRHRHTACDAAMHEQQNSFLKLSGSVSCFFKCDTCVNAFFGSPKMEQSCRYKKFWPPHWPTGGTDSDWLMMLYVCGAKN